MRAHRRALVLSVGLALISAGLVLRAQPAGTGNASGGTSDSSATSGTSSSSSGQVAPPGVPIIEAPPEPSTPPANAAAPEIQPESENSEPTNKVEAKAPPAPPPAPVLPVRSPAAILQVLDKVTAETMRFAAPVDQHVRYKNVVFTVKSCETTGLGDASPQASAYVVVDSAPLPVEGMAPAPAKRVFKGWMFADSPGLNPLQHPVYDAWLIACMAPPPPPGAIRPNSPAS